MASEENRELLDGLAEAASQLAAPPSDVDELVSLLDKTEECLTRIEQSPFSLTSAALQPVMKALVANFFLGHTDEDVKISVTSCISEITRITAPDAPYDDDLMKVIFQMIVEAFRKLDDTSNRVFQKRISILDTVAKVRSCVVMLDLECDALILEMFRSFLKTIRSNHPDGVFSSMVMIMTLVLEESEDISLELLLSLLDSIKDNQDVLPIARQLGKKVIRSSISKIKPYLISYDLSDYSKIVASISEDDSDTVENPERNVSDALEPAERNVPDEVVAFFPSLTKIVGTLGQKTRSVEVLEACLSAGMSVARFDFSWLYSEYHQQTLDNLKAAVKNARKLCAVMLDTMGPELQVLNISGNSIELKADDHVVITPDHSKVPSSEVLPVNFTELAKVVKEGDTIFLGQYLFTGSETTSVWLEVAETFGDDVVCLVKNSAILTSFIFTMHVAQVQINLPTLTNTDKQVISSWGVRNNVDIVSLSYTHCAEDVQELRAFLDSQNLLETQIYAKVENVEGLKHFDAILQEADGIILSRGNLGIDLPPEKVFSFQKSAIYKCNMVGKPVIVTRVVDSMTDNLRPTRAEVTDVANTVLDGADGILLGAETLRGLYPVETIKTVGRICAEAECVYNQGVHFKRIVKYVGEPMSHAESVASSAVRAAITVCASVIVVFTSSGKAARLIAKYRPPMPVLAVVIPRLKANSLKWTLSGTTQAKQCVALRGIYPILASPDVSTKDISREDSGLALALDYGKSVGILKAYDRAVIFQKIGDSFVVKIVDFQDS